MKYDAFSKCHPLVNFLFFLVAIGFGVVIQHPAYIFTGFCCAFLYYLLLKGRGALKLLLSLVPMFVFLTVINPLFNQYGDRVLFYILGNPYTLEALFYGMAISGVFMVMTVWFLCYNVVLTSDKFVCLFGSLIPSLSMLLVMVLRMIPNLMRKAMQFSNSRKSIGKGAGDQSTKKEKLHDGVQILSALTDWALEGSVVTADSMRARGYGSGKRTNFQLYHMTVRDYIIISLTVILAMMVLVCGNMSATYTPELYIDTPGWGLGCYCLYLLIPTVMQIKEAVQWNISISRI